MTILKNSSMMNLRTILFLAGVSLVVFNTCTWAHIDVTAEQARDLINSTDDLIIIDVSEHSEYWDARGHIPGALNYPWDALVGRRDELPMDGPILVVSRSGVESDNAAYYLDLKGFTMVYDMLGGMDAWIWETEFEKYNGGSGTAVDPYHITTAEDLLHLGDSPEDYDKHFILTADIDLDPNLPGRRVFRWAIFNAWVGHFTGVFDGNGHTISHLMIRGHQYLGLFGRLKRGAEIKNLGVVNVDIVGSGFSVGALLGNNEGGSVINCYSSGAVNGERWVGGLVGSNRPFGSSLGRITCSYTDCTVRGDNAVGGLAGYSSSMITHSYATGNVEGNAEVGGLVGDNNNGAINKSYAIADVSGTTNVGGLVGRDSPFKTREITYSFWDIQKSGQEESGGGTGKTTAEMQDPNTFMDAGWDFVDKPGWPSDVWVEPAGGGYPILWWQVSPTLPLPDFSGGTGEAEDPYLISTAAELNSIGHNPRLMRAHFKMTNDIDLAETDFYFMGNEAIPFAGVFDGNGFLISNFSYTSDANCVGLFGYVENPDAEIKYLGLIDPNVDGGAGEFVGSLVGHLKGGNITGCSVDGGSVTAITYVGGMVGGNTYGTITECCSSTTVSGEWEVGGIVGSDVGGTITECYVEGGSVYGHRHVGGLEGLSSGSTIFNCYTQGCDVSGFGTEWAHGTVGGLVGLSLNSTIINCYSTSSVVGRMDEGGLVGIGDCAHNSFWDIQTSGQDISAGGKGRTTAQLQMASTFLGWDSCGNEGVWTIDEGNDYPRLRWENRPGELLETQQLPDLLTGDGTEDEPYLVHTAEELNMIGLFPCEWDKHFRLMADVNLSDYTGTEFNIIGIPSSFAGVFDGNGKRIIDLDQGSGFFMYVSGTIKNLGLIDPNVDAGRDFQVGSLVNCLKGGTIASCYSDGGSVSGFYYIGGLVGENQEGTIRNCYTTSSVLAFDAAGGLVGGNNGRVTNCYSTGSVISEFDIGGLIGVVRGEMDEVTSSFWDTQASGCVISARGTAKTTAEMQTAATFLDAGWDFIDETANGTEDIWWIDEGQDYPRLWWEPLND